MKNLFKSTIIILFVLFNTLVLAQEVQKGLIGRWESDVIANSKVGTTWQFNENGTVEITSGAIVHYVYIFKGKQLISALFNHMTGETTLDTSYIEIRGDSLFQTYKIKNKKHTRTMIRKSKKRNSRMLEVGIWETKNIAGQKSYYQFNNDHTLILRVPLSTKKGTYRVNKFNLKLKLKGEKEETYKIKFLARSLQLKNIKNKIEKTFHRLYE